MLSGGDPIPGEMKNKAPFDFVNTAKLLINTNSLPQTSDKTDAFYSRCILVEFGKQFQLGKDIIETIPDPNGTVAAWRIFEKYVAYCIEKGYRKPQNQRDFNNMLKVNYEVEKKNKFDDDVKDWVHWVWVLGIKSKDLPNLPNLLEVPLPIWRNPMRY